MQFLLIDLNPKVAEAWKRVFEAIPQVTVQNDSIFNHPCDALVSPANSFGYMNGGIDFAISKHLGWHVEKRLQQVIRERYFGELLVGQAEIVPTDHADFPWLISAPTMRNPMTLSHSPNVYLAMKAILILLRTGRMPDGSPAHERIGTVAIPGLGTGVGQVPPLVCARQMRIAWEDIMGAKYLEKEDWKVMGLNSAYFYTNDPRDIRYEIP